MPYSTIVGTGGYAPERIVSNMELEKLVETSDQWIRGRTGIAERRVSTRETTRQIAIEAAYRAIRNAKVEPEEIDLLILSTITPDFFTPSTASLVQAEIGLKKTTSFDISAGCTGFIYGLQIADQFIKTGHSRCALVIGAEVLSKVLDWHDRNTCVLFGDGAGAAILKKSKTAGIISTYTGSKGDLDGLLTLPAVALRNPFLADHKIPEHDSFIYMEGKEIFKFATQVMLESIQVVLTENKLNIQDIDFIIPHQANNRIIDHVAKKLNIPAEKFFKNIEHYGNTSAASIPLAMDEMVKDGLIQKNNHLILVGFGGGLTWGSVLLRWTI